jgi:hypothetical protein
VEDAFTYKKSLDAVRIRKSKEGQVVEELSEQNVMVKKPAEMPIVVIVINSADVE